MSVLKIFLKQELQVHDEKMGTSLSSEYAFIYIFDHFCFENMVVVFWYVELRLIHSSFLFACHKKPLNCLIGVF